MRVSVRLAGASFSRAAPHAAPPACIISSLHRFSLQQAKAYIYQLCRVLDYLHGQGYVHRDIKTSNLLLTDDNVLKLGDFGLARSLRQHDGSGRFTNTVITLWYRPPELLCGATEYDAAVDMWSVGCILLELLLGKPLFPARTEAEAMKRIVQVLGSPPATSPLRSLPLWADFDVRERPPSLLDYLSRYIAPLDPELLHLASRLLEWDPRLRLSAREVLTQRWFSSAPRIDRDAPNSG